MAKRGKAGHKKKGKLQTSDVRSIIEQWKDRGGQDRQAGMTDDKERKKKMPCATRKQE
jgi:hypothetical protein